MVKETALYESLEITPEATEGEIKKAFKMVALKWHPDKNGHSKESTEKFQEISTAYKVLMDPKLRAVYDRYGAQGIHNSDPVELDTVRKQSTFSTKTDELFRQFFGDDYYPNSNYNQNARVSSPGGFNHTLSNYTRKTTDIRHKLACTLEELYNGKTAKLGLSRTILCPTCDAKGGMNIKHCLQCQGRGRVLVEKTVGTVVRRFETICRACNGCGEVMDIKDRCTNCHGSKTVEERKILVLDVAPGTTNGEQITYEREGDQGIGVVPGDVVVTIEELKHPSFGRNGANLYHRATIDLLTALTGGYFLIKHLNGDTLKVDIIPGEIIRPSSFKTITGCGMPRKGLDSFGDLVIYFEIEFPKDGLNEEAAHLLARALPDKPELKIPENAITVEKVLSDYNPDEHAYKSCSEKPSNPFSKKRRKRNRLDSTDSSNSPLESVENSSHSSDSPGYTPTRSSQPPL